MDLTTSQSEEGWINVRNRSPQGNHSQHFSGIDNITRSDSASDDQLLEKIKVISYHNMTGTSSPRSNVAEKYDDYQVDDYQVDWMHRGLKDLKTQFCCRAACTASVVLTCVAAVFFIYHATNAAKNTFS